MISVHVLFVSCASRSIGTSITRIETPSGVKPIKGNYAAFVQSGGWNVKVKNLSLGFEIPQIINTEIDINTEYMSAVKNILEKGLEKVSFVGKTLHQSELISGGYDAQIIIYQGYAEARMENLNSIILNTFKTSVELKTIVAIVRQNKPTYQVEVYGKKSAICSMFDLCRHGSKENVKTDLDINIHNIVFWVHDKMIGNVASEAIEDLGSKLFLYIRDALNSSVPYKKHNLEAKHTENTSNDIKNKDGNSRNIKQTINAWSQAWSSKDIESYLSFYSDNFMFPKKFSSRNEWEGQRYQSFESAGNIQVTLTNMKVTFTDETHARVTFSQDYRSDTYRDRVKKTLSLQKEGDTWKITRELS